MALLTIRSLPPTAHPLRKSSSAGPPCGGRRHLTNSDCRYLRVLLVENAEVSTPELVVVNGAQLRPGREALLETGDVVDLQLRARHVGRVTAGRVGQHERLGEV